MDLKLKERIVLISGGSIGIGYAVAEAFASEGAHVIACARDEERLNASVKTLQEKYPQSKIFGKKTDVSKLEEIEALVQFVEEQFDGLDILVNNAGTGSAEKNMTAPDEKWYHYWDLHVMAAVRLARLCVPLMRKREGEGVIIHTASICATQPLDYEPIYNVTKAALVMYSKCLANELISENIRVNTISPGLIRTPDWNKTAAIVSREKGMTSDEYLTNIAKENAPIGRFASAEELAQFYLFLCSPQASYCVGSNYYVDGGWLKVIS